MLIIISITQKWSINLNRKNPKLYTKEPHTISVQNEAMENTTTKSLTNLKFSPKTPFPFRIYQ